MKFKAVCLVLGLCQAGSAAALGLGELTVRSSLGQPLHATIRIIDASAAIDADCFSLKPSADSAAPLPARAQLTLERRGNDAILHVRTPAAVGEPIAQFSLTSDCESRLQRDYVVLLDPPSTALARSDLAARPESGAADDAPAATDPPAPRARTRAPREPASTTRRAAVSPRPHDAQPQRQAAATDAAPRLVLSGRHGMRPGALALRFDTTLPDLDRPRPVALTPDELSDENTALTRKLAYLESQLRELNRRNTELEARRSALSAPPASPDTRNRSPQWPLYLLGAALLLGATAGVLIWRRRSQPGDSHAPAPAGATPDAPDLDKLADDPWTTRPQVTTPGTRAATQTRNEPVAEFGPSATHTTEVNDDILDQAEVYMAHGHGDLAIHLLQEHLRAAPDESPVPWLLLLDLLHREGDTAGYAAASTECRRYFNIKLSGQGASQDGENGQGIEAYPHILEQLLKVWGTPDADDFFADLIFDRRGGTRIGFEPKAYREILLLRTIAEARQ